MKTQPLQKLLLAKIGFFLLLSFVVVYAADSLSETLTTQTATWSGSNNSLISVSFGGANTNYVNKENNSTIIWNYFTGYYYDSVFGYFKLDWSADVTENVSIVSETTECSSGYGYKLGGYAYSTYYGLIDFDYSPSVFVYYCESDNKFHGYAYSEHLGFQNFEWIGFQIVPSVSTAADTLSSTGFLNDTTAVTTTDAYTGSDSTFSPLNIWGDINELDADQESIFYIIK